MAGVGGVALALIPGIRVVGVLTVCVQQKRQILRLVHSTLTGHYRCMQFTLYGERGGHVPVRV